MAVCLATPQHRAFGVGEDRNKVLRNKRRPAVARSTGPSGSVRIATTYSTRAIDDRGPWQHRPFGVGEDRNPDVHPTLVGWVAMQHRPFGVGEDRNMGDIQMLLRESKQHRPFGVGEDRNEVGVMEKTRKNPAAPALRGR